MGIGPSSRCQPWGICYSWTKGCCFSGHGCTRCHHRWLSLWSRLGEATQQKLCAWTMRWQSSRKITRQCWLDHVKALRVLKKSNPSVFFLIHQLSASHAGDFCQKSSCTGFHHKVPCSMDDLTVSQEWWPPNGSKCTGFDMRYTFNIWRHFIFVAKWCNMETGILQLCG